MSTLGIMLTVKRDDGTVLARLRWADGRTRVVEAGDDVRPAIQRWLDNGLDEWVGEREDATPRSTPSSAPEFLERVKAYLERQFLFQADLGDLEERGFTYRAPESQTSFLISFSSRSGPPCPRPRIDYKAAEGDSCRVASY
jgi:hypothetical protein